MWTELQQKNTIIICKSAFFLLLRQVCKVESVIVHVSQLHQHASYLSRPGTYVVWAHANYAGTPPKEWKIILELLRWVYTVSYTHLDVYKRQPLYRKCVLIHVKYDDNSTVTYTFKLIYFYRINYFETLRLFWHLFNVIQ